MADVISRVDDPLIVVIPGPVPPPAYAPSRRPNGILAKAKPRESADRTCLAGDRDGLFHACGTQCVDTVQCAAPTLFGRCCAAGLRH